MRDVRRTIRRVEQQEMDYWKARTQLHAAGISLPPSSFSSRDSLASMSIALLSLAEFAILIASRVPPRAAVMVVWSLFLFGSAPAYNAWAIQKTRVRAWRRSAMRQAGPELRGAVQRVAAKEMRSLRDRDGRMRRMPATQFGRYQWPANYRNTQQSLYSAFAFFLSVVLFGLASAVQSLALALAAFAIGCAVVAHFLVVEWLIPRIARVRP